MFDKIRSEISLKRQYYVWIINYAVIIVLSILINFIGFDVVIKVIEEEIAQTGISGASQIRNIYDNYFEGIESLAYSTLYSYNVERIIRSKLPEDVQLRTEVIKNINRDISVQTVNQRLISNALVIFRESDIAIDATGMYKLSDAYDAYFQNSYESCRW